MVISKLWAVIIAIVLVVSALFSYYYINQDDDVNDNDIDDDISDDDDDDDIGDDDQLELAHVFTVPDTGQLTYYDNDSEMLATQIGDDFHGQDALYSGYQMSYIDNGDGTITDKVTGLIWQKAPMENKLTWSEAKDQASDLDFAGHTDWRLPSIKELYSLIDFTGMTRMDAASSVPYINTQYFDFEYGDTSTERFIDAQYWSSTKYVGTTMNDDPTAFGVNFADGRIKGYPCESVVGPDGPFTKTAFVRYVRGNVDYGQNQFIDNGDDTISDNATGLMWMEMDSAQAMNWEDALDYAENLVYGGHDDWRLPNAKELQSIVDYTRAPDSLDVSMQGPAIDPIFQTTETESFFWSSTTHLDGPTSNYAVYLAFGQAAGWMQQPPNSGNYVLLNVHGAGAQRSDPKSGDPTEYPYGHGPQGDEIRIFNYVRCVRDI